MMDEHEQLLNRWAEKDLHKGKGFIRDGIVDPVRWNSAARKVLFLLREAYDSEKRAERFDLRSWLCAGEWGRARTWPTVADWAFLAQSTENCCVPLPEVTKEVRRNSLLSSAIVNVKKSSGKKKSDPVEIADYAKQDGELIQKQVNLIGPDIVICGGTWREFQSLWGRQSHALYDHVYQIREPRRHFILFWHPSNQFPRMMNYYTMGSLLQFSGCLTASRSE